MRFLIVRVTVLITMLIKVFNFSVLTVLGSWVQSAAVKLKESVNVACLDL